MTGGGEGLELPMSGRSNCLVFTDVTK